MPKIAITTQIIMPKISDILNILWLRRALLYVFARILKSGISATWGVDPNT